MIIEAKALQVAPVEWILHMKYLGRSKTELLQHVLETLLFSAIFTLVIWSVCSNVIGIYEFDPVGQECLQSIWTILSLGTRLVESSVCGH